jgi:hypothetical protein
MSKRYSTRSRTRKFIIEYEGDVISSIEKLPERTVKKVELVTWSSLDACKTHDMSPSSAVKAMVPVVNGFINFIHQNVPKSIVDANMELILHMTDARLPAVYWMAGEYNDLVGAYPVSSVLFYLRTTHTNPTDSKFITYIGMCLIIQRVMEVLKRYSDNKRSAVLYGDFIDRVNNWSAIDAKAMFYKWARLIESYNSYDQFGEDYIRYLDMTIAAGSPVDNKHRMFNEIFGLIVLK